MEPLAYEQIEQLVQNAFHAKAREKNINLSKVEFTDQLDLRDQGIFDSLDILNLLSALESATGIEIEFEKIEPERLTRYSSLVQLFRGEHRGSERGGRG